ncbi:MAG: hypothetical protein V2A66_09310 [Pseudomonadota bacterium]
MKNGKLASVVIVALALCGCASSHDIFTNIGTQIASPSAIVIDVASNRLYLVNSNSLVLYNPEQGNFQAYDITSPLAPRLLGTTQTPSFSGQIYLDTVGKRAYVPNRYTTNSVVTQDRLLTFNVDESSAGFLTSSETALDRDSYAIACCYPATRAWITTGMNELQYIAIGGDLTPAGLSLLTPLSDGGNISDALINNIVFLGSQAFLSRTYGGVMIVNLDEAGVAGAFPVDYVITDIDNPRGIATDGKYIYVVGEGTIDDDYERFLDIVDPTTLTSTTTNTSAKTVSRSDPGILVVPPIIVGNSPQEVLLSTANAAHYAFVTNQGDNNVSVIDITSPTSASKIKDIPVGDQPFSMALYSTGGVDQYVYVGNIYSNTISIIDIPSLTVVATYP